MNDWIRFGSIRFSVLCAGTTLVNREARATIASVRCCCVGKLSLSDRFGCVLFCFVLFCFVCYNENELLLNRAILLVLFLHVT
jgi:hypothetical protein